jgi:dolichol-phosphate mannosyltransferase
MARTQDIAAPERILVVVPTYNEKDNIGRLIPEVLGQHPGIEILVVDDNSPDGTGQLVAELARATSRVHLLSRREKLGLGTAYVAGFQFALDHGYELVVEMDADFSHAPGEIPRFLQAMPDCDLVVGSRYMAGGATSHWPRRRQWLSRGANRYTRWLTGLPLKDATSGYRCFRRRVLAEIGLERIGANGFVFQVEVAFRAWKLGFRTREIPIVFADRTRGQSKLDKRIVWEALWRLCKLRWLSLTGRL